MFDVSTIPTPVLKELRHLIHQAGEQWKCRIIHGPLSRTTYPEVTGYCSAFGTSWLAFVTKADVLEEHHRRLVAGEMGL